MILTYQGKKIGRVVDRVLHKNITSPDQLMGIFGRTPGFQDTIEGYLDQFDSIQVTYEETVFSTSKENWLKHREHRNFGHGGQYFMHEKHWEIGNAKDQKLGI